MDIVDELREDTVGITEAMRQRRVAADEIKRLRAALHTARNRPNIADAYHDAIDECERLRAENNLLQAAQGMLKKELMEIGQALNDPRDNLTLTTAECIAELRAEVDRLRGLLIKQADVIETINTNRAVMREALVRLRDCDWKITLPDRMDAVREIARDALAGTVY